MELALFFLPIYAVAFLAAFLLRRPIWLAGGSVAAIILIVVLYGLLQHNGGGESALGGYLAIYTFAIGFAVGGAARLALILLRLRWKSKALAVPIALLFFFGVPLAISGWSQLQHA